MNPAITFCDDCIQPIIGTVYSRGEIAVCYDCYVDKAGRHPKNESDVVGETYNSPAHTDTVNRPAHYTQNKIEAIDYLEDTLGEGFSYFCEGNVKKYMHRWRYKHGVEDLRKAQWYLDRLIKWETRND